MNQTIEGYKVSIMPDGKIIDLNGHIHIGTVTPTVFDGSFKCIVYRPYATPMEWQHDHGRERAIAAVVKAYKRHVEGMEKPYQAAQTLPKPDTCGGLSIS